MIVQITITSCLIIVLCFLGCNPNRAVARERYESDQFVTIGLDLEDSKPTLNMYVNSAIQDVAKQWNVKADSSRFAYALASRFSSRQLESWVINNPLIDTANTFQTNVYIAAGFINAPMLRYKGLSPTLQLNGVQIGADKFSHFFGVGTLYLQEFLKHDSIDEGEKAALEFGVFTEHWYWGELTTSVFSNADLVANYEGFRFLRGLFEDNNVPGKIALMRWEGDRPIQQRPFDFGDYVNDYWNEVMNPNSYQPSLGKHVVDYLRVLCLKPEIRNHPEILVSANDKYLTKKYAHLGMHNNRSNFRMTKICSDFSSMSIKEKNETMARFNKAQSQYNQRNLEMQSGQNISLEKAVEISSEKPFCKQSAILASREHQEMLNWYDKNYEKFVKIFALPTNKNTITHIDNVAVILSQANKEGGIKCIESLLTNKAVRMRDGVELSVRICGEIGEDGHQLIVPQYRVEYENTITAAIVDFSPFFGNFMDGQFMHYSMKKDYFEFGNAVGYIYRTIPPLCRWF